MASAGNPKDDTGLERKMESRHLTMISLGGVIGTGLFVSSGYTIHQAGPLGAILAYAVGSLLVYCVMVSLGELSVAMPYAGSFHMYAKRFIGPGTAFTIAILYWLNWAVALASEFTAAGLLMQRWFPHSPSWVWSAVFIVVVWFSVCVCHIRFRREWARDGHSADELDYRAPGFPVLPWLAIVMCIGALVLVVLDETQRSTLIA